MTNDPSLGEMAGDVLDLVVGSSVILLPAYILAVPCIVLCVVPLLIVGALLAAVAGVLAAPILLVRMARRAVSSRGWRPGMT
jgi:hypothetical protein